MKILFQAVLLSTILAVPSFAAISELEDSQKETKDTSSSDLKAFISFSGSNILLHKDGSLVFSLRGGITLSEAFRLGIYASTVANDVNAKEDGKNISIDYNALGFLGEWKPVIINKFSISIPASLGAGYVNIQTQGEENSQAKDGFFTADAALHFNYQITPALLVGIGGGYRIFLGINEDGFKNSDFNTPFGELVICWGEN